MPNKEMLKQLLDDFVEKEALIKEELQVIDEEIRQLEQRLTKCKDRMGTIGIDRDKVMAIRDRYVNGNFPRSVQLPEQTAAKPTELSKPKAEPKPEVKVQSVEDVRISRTGMKKISSVDPTVTTHPSLAGLKKPTAEPQAQPEPAPPPEPPTPEVAPIKPVEELPVPEPVAEAPAPEPFKEPAPVASMDNGQDEDEDYDGKSGITALLEGLRSRDPQQKTEPAKAEPKQQPKPEPAKEEPPAPAPAAAADVSASSESDAAAENAEESDSDTVKSINEALRSLFR